MQPITPSLAFFYNPPGFLVNYHITCEEVPMSFELVYQLTNDTDDNDQTYNYVQSKSYAFYHSQIDTKRIYLITYYNQQSVQQHQQQEIFPLHFKSHLKQLLTNYLAPKEIYKQNLHENMMQDNFNEEVMNGTPSFRNASGDYNQDLNLNNENIQQGV
ncbi:unnamed protein product [Rhizophagus irregularis]|nr:unnamed protein product [Rhizophagus irregularis]